MQSITSADALHAAIVALNTRRREQEQELNNRYLCFVESLKPLNVVKTIVRDAGGSPGGRHPMLKAGVGLAVGYLFRRLLFGGPSGPLKRIVGAALQIGLTGLIRK